MNVKTKPVESKDQTPFFVRNVPGKKLVVKTSIKAGDNQEQRAK